jgi:glycosyltransferase involved in cell wall biosynthesis
MKVSGARPINVLAIDPYTEIGGPHQVMGRIVRRLAPAGFAFTVVTPSDGATYQDLKSAGASVVAMPEVIPLTRLSGLRGSTSIGMGWISATIRLVVLIRRLHIDVVHSNTPACWVGGLAARLSGRPSVYHVHDLTLGSQRLIGLAIGVALGLTADRIICVSEAAKQALPVPRLTRGKAVVIYNAVDTAEFCFRAEQRRLMRRDLGIPLEVPVVASFGGLERRKGQDCLVSAAAHVVKTIPQAQFLIVGGDAPGAKKDGYADMVRGLAKQLGLEQNVRFLGPRADIPSLMCGVDVVAQPSLIEAGPLVPLEAMASALPVVATNVGANPEEVDDGVTGVLVPVADPGRMAQEIISLLQDQPRRKQMGAAGRRRVEEHFELKKQAEKVAEIYESLFYQTHDGWE